MKSATTLFATAGLAALFAGTALAQEGVMRTDAIVFATVDGQDLMLDLYTPVGVDNPPVLIWAHGGGWQRGSRDELPVVELVQNGYAFASIDYRLAPASRFPAQIYDLKAAIRYLRGNAAELGIDPNRIGSAGSSAGAHLALLLGVTNGAEELEGHVGEYDNVSSDVSMILAYFPASDLTTILDQSTEFGYGVRAPALEALLGGLPEAVPELAQLASPVYFVDAGDPPLFVLHGDRDPQMPINQSHQIEGEYERFGLPVHFEVVHGGVHGGDGFYDSDRTAKVSAFLDEYFKAAD
jgi:acetyl esterase/lipase